jgi:PAS domain S-box-containing protein
MTDFAAEEIKGKLYLLVAFAIIPALVVILYMAFREREHALTATRGQLQAVTTSVARLQLEKSRQAHLILKALADLPQVKAKDVASCNAIFSSILADNPDVANIVLMDSQGNALAAGLPINEKLNFSDRTSFKDAVRTRSFSAGDYVLSKMAKVSVMQFSYPIIVGDAGDLVGVLFYSYKLDGYGEYFKEVSLPRGSRSVLLDRNSVRLVDFSEHVKSPELGTKILSENWGKISESKNDTGIFEGTRYDGVEVIFYFYKLRLRPDEPPYAVVLTSSSLSEVFADGNRMLLSILGILAIAVIISSLVAKSFSNAFILSQVAALQESEKRFRLLFNEMLSGFALHEIICDESGQPVDYRFLEVNPAFERLTGLQKADLLGRTVLEVMPTTEPRWIETYGQVALTGVPIEFEEYSHPLCRWFEIKAYSPSPGQFAVLFKDTTARKQAEDKLAEGAERLRLALDAAKAGVWEWDLRTNENYWSDELRSLYRLDQKNVVPSYDEWLQLIQPEDRAALAAAVQATVSHQEELNIEWRLNDPCGPECWLMSRGHFKKDKGGEVQRYLGIVMDITQRKLFEEELSRSRKLAEEANNVKSEFLANLSHEIRTPLNGVLGMLQLLQQEIEPEDRATYTGMAYDAGRRLLSLLNDVLDFSKMEAGQLHLANARFSLGAAADDVAEVFVMACHAKELKLTTVVDPSVPACLVGDEARLRQILFNLIGNAIKFTPSGSVQVDVWAHASKRFADKTRVYISVSDTGLGIPDDKQAHIFDRFTQVDGSYTRRFDGAGLGLAIVKRIVDFMHGDITVDSEEGKGTTIYLNLLLDNAVQIDAGGGEEVAHVRPTLTPLRILLSDDEPIGQRSLQVMLERMGHEVHTAINGREVIEAYQQGEFDCILMDIQMPELDGVEATRIIRSMSKFGVKQKIPIIALTAYAMHGDREKFLEAGMDDYVGKPVQLEELKKALELVMSAK